MAGQAFVTRRSSPPRGSSGSNRQPAKKCNFAVYLICLAGLCAVILALNLPEIIHNQQHEFRAEGGDRPSGVATSDITRRKASADSEVTTGKEDSRLQDRGEYNRSKANAEVLISRYYEKPKQAFVRTKFTHDNFVVAGINLAEYGLQNDTAGLHVKHDSSIPAFDLYQDFDISHLIQGDEGWKDLLAYRKHLQRPSISFYGDKVAQKRWMNASGIPTTQAFELKYRSELTQSGSQREMRRTIAKLLKGRTNFVAKPTHKAAASGVWVVKHDDKTGKKTVGYGGKRIKHEYHEDEVVERLVRDLHLEAGPEESWALRHVNPGFVIEERFTNFIFDEDEEDDDEEDDRPATEFKLFMIWGKVWIVNWKRGKYRRGLVHRNGTVVDCLGKRRDSLPKWVDWDRVVNLAESLAANKDLFRADVFVGVPAGSPVLKKSATRHEQLNAVKYVISETAFHPTSTFEDEIFDEGARLWIAGYKMGNFRVVPNTEVPEAFKKRNMLSEDDADCFRTQRLEK